jgi:RND family efflux transporter MFP subunit
MTDLKADLAALRIDRAPEARGASRWVGRVILLVILLAVGVAVWKWATRERPIEVQVATVTERAAGTQAAVLNASGYVTARRRATVSSKITGKVVEVNVEEGMAVKEGQVLARLDDTTARATLSLAKAQAESARKSVNESDVHLAQARLNHTRVAELAKQRVASQSELDQVRSEVEVSEARINALREQIHVAERQIELQQAELDNTIIRAPFTGIAVTKDAQPGEMVSPVSAGGGFTRTGICTIVDMHSLEIEVDVNENYINRVRPRQRVTAVLDAYPDWQIPAHVITIVPTANRQKATVLVRIAFEQLDPRLLPDMGVKVTLLREERETGSVTARATMLVPKAAVQTDNANNFVFVVAGETVDRRVVKVGGADGDRVEVLGALRPGDRVVISPAQNFANGAKVVVK